MTDPEFRGRGPRPLELSTRQRRVIIRAVVLYIVANLAIWGMVVIGDYNGDVDRNTERRAACERGKIANGANARSWTAHREYIEGVTGAASVKPDVKLLASTANATHTMTAAQLTKLSEIDCAEEFPKPKFVSIF